jgi:hypothetical protein
MNISLTTVKNISPSSNTYCDICDVLLNTKNIVLHGYEELSDSGECGDISNEVTFDICFPCIAKLTAQARELVG